MRIFLVHDGIEYEYEPKFAPVGNLPDPVSFPGRLIADESHNGRIARLRHDPYPRKPGFQTNETESMHSEDFRSKITFKINQAWTDEWIRLNGPWVASPERMFRQGAGWFDTGFPTFSLLDTGGNLEIIPPGAHLEGGGWIDIDYQRFQDGPQGIDWKLRPDLVIKQTLVAGTTTTRILIDKGAMGGLGDAYIPKVSPTRPHHSAINRDGHNGLQFFPSLPCETKLNDVPVTVTRWGFYGSNTYAEIGGLWYLAEEMLVIGGLDDMSRGGTMDDRRTYLDCLRGMPCPPPVIGWTRQR